MTATRRETVRSDDKESPLAGNTGGTLMKALGIIVLAGAIVFAGHPARAVTTLEGYSEMVTEIRSSGGGDPSWDMSNPRLYSELRLKTSPWEGVDSYLKISAESNRWVDDVKDTEFFLNETHMHYRGSNFETYLFAGQDRFWLNEPLLEIVNAGVVKHDDYGPRAQGIRFDFWGVKGFDGAGFVSERSDYFDRAWDGLSPAEQELYPGAAVGDSVTSSTDDYRGLRVTRKLLDDRVYLGTTYARKDYNDTAFQGGSEFFDEAVAFDVELAVGELLPPLARLGRVTWISEVGHNTSGHLWGEEDAERNGFKTELRDVRTGPVVLRGSYETFGRDFYTYGLNGSQDMNDRYRYYVEGHYRVPTKAVNLKGWKKHTGMSDVNDLGEADEWGAEAYVEFVNGFTGRTFYKVYEDDYGTWPNLFFEVAAENRLVDLRTQFRIKDIDSRYELTAYGFEANLNLADDWKFYTRIMNVAEKTESRQTAFAQVRYLGWNGGEFFVEFGDPGHSNDLVEDDDFVSHGSSSTTDKVFKAFVKIYY